MMHTLYKFVNNEEYTIYTEAGKIKSLVYPLPTLNADGSYTPGAWIEPQDGILEEYSDISECGANRLHLMKSISAKYAPFLWKCYTAEGEGLIGESDEKVSYRRVRLLEPVDIVKLAREGKLRGVNLQGADLCGENFREMDLRETIFAGANLRGACFQEARLKRTNFIGADLRGANLWRANLWGAYFSGADITEANFREANVKRIFFWKTDLRKADFRGADFRGAYLTKEQEKDVASRGAIV